MDKDTKKTSDDSLIKEERKKKAHRKKDRFWNLVFPHYKSNKPKLNNSSKNDKRSAEQVEKINSLSAYAQKKFSISLDSELFDSILENNGWDSKKAMVDLMDYEEASHGILVEPPSNSKLKLLGCENDGGTSCYIDALFFAMYISNTSFDPLLTYDIPSEEDDKIKLQTIMRLFVNKLRKGHFVSAEHVHWFRKLLQDSKWNGKDENGYWTQEDSSELFMFITETFELPYLPFQIRLFHGANSDNDDDRLMTDRTLALSIPADDNNDVGTTTLQLQDILVDYFYNSIITGVRRQVGSEEEGDDGIHLNNSIAENVAASPSMTAFNQDFNATDEKDTLKKLLQQAKRKSRGNIEEEEVAVTAWQVLELLPFYSAMNEQGDAIRTQMDSSFPDTHMILPIVLKRYRYNNDGRSTKIKKRVEIPVTIDFNKFVNQNVDDPLCPICGHLINWTLHFKSAVCHKGDSPYSGHYISYARVQNVEEEEPYWLQLDDMNSSSRITVIKDSHASSIYADLAENAYIVFYELDKTCHHGTRLLRLSSSDSEEVENKDDFKSTDSTSTHETDTEEKICNCEEEKSESNSKSKKSSKHKHHHHHYDRYHLKESCSLM